MRALCGAIISAGALIGLGLFSIGVGTRYSAYPYLDPEGKAHWVHFNHLDTALMLSMVVLLAALAIGLGIAFVGLAYHHHRRTQELLHLHRHAQPTDRPPSERLTL
jgi:putative Mn2+ efflux pump MntP